MKIISALLVICLTGCSTVVGMIPSFWDDNQSSRIVDLQVKIEQIDCAKPQAAQVRSVQADLLWFRLYSEGKGQRQQDVLRLIKPMSDSADEWSKRVSAEGYKENPVYCRLKREVMQAQSKRAAEAVLGRF